MKGICFTEPLFHKVVKGEKTQTRRMITIQPPDNRNWRIGTLMDSTAKEDKKKIGKNHYLLFENEYTIKESLIKTCFSPKYQVGEEVYLKEPYAETCDEYGSPLIAYRFDNTALYLVRKDENGDYYQLNTIKKPVTTNWTINNFPACGEWKNKLFMPEWAARYFIEITAVRAERLQDISEDDCIKEGIDSFFNPLFSETRYKDYLNPNSECRSPQSSYASLINKINGKGTWEKNPFVWVYDFRLIEK